MSEEREYSNVDDAMKKEKKRQRGARECGGGEMPPARWARAAGQAAGARYVDALQRYAPMRPMGLHRLEH